jgi:hypothetical protein
VGLTQIWDAGGPTVTSGTVTLNIYGSAEGDTHGALVFTASATLPTPTCTTSTPIPTSTPTPTSQVAAISTPDTGSGPGPGPLPPVGMTLGLLLVLLGCGLFVARRLSTIRIEDV